MLQIIKGCSAKPARAARHGYIICSPRCPRNEQSNAITPVRGTLLRDTSAVRGIRLCNVITLVRGIRQRRHARCPRNRLGNVVTRFRGTRQRRHAARPAEIYVNSKINNVARGIHFPASGLNLRILAPRRVKWAQLCDAGPVKIAPARAEPSTNANRRHGLPRFTLILK